MTLVSLWKGEKYHCQHNFFEDTVSKKEIWEMKNFSRQEPREWNKEHSLSSFMYVWVLNAVGETRKRRILGKLRSNAGKHGCHKVQQGEMPDTQIDVLCEIQRKGHFRKSPLGKIFITKVGFGSSFVWLGFGQKCLEQSMDGKVVLRYGGSALWPETYV